jgi:hypothetical protein
VHLYIKEILNLILYHNTKPIREFINQNSLVYFGIIKDESIIHILNGTIKGKIGYTNQSISKRFSFDGHEKGMQEILIELNQLHS